MPTYEYIAPSASILLKQTQSIKAKPLATCPREILPKKPWEKARLRRATWNRGGLIFKGSGFYTTDYRSDKYKAAAKKDAAPLRDLPLKAQKRKAKQRPRTQLSSHGPASSSSPAPPKKEEDQRERMVVI